MRIEWHTLTELAKDKFNVVPSKSLKVLGLGLGLGVKFYPSARFFKQLPGMCFWRERNALVGKRCLVCLRTCP
jgi:hypothetical protein